MQAHLIKHRPAVILFAVVIPTLVACHQDPHRLRVGRPPVDDQASALPLDPIPDLPSAGPQSLMAAKLAHAQAILEGIALEDFDQIAKNAQHLNRISQEADWLVRRTVDYKVFSTEFRRITQDMVKDAAHKNIHAVTLDYMQMTMTCVKCHSYMRHEGLAQGRIPNGVDINAWSPRLDQPHLTAAAGFKSPSQAGTEPSSTMAKVRP